MTDQTLREAAEEMVTLADMDRIPAPNACVWFNAFDRRVAALRAALAVDAPEGLWGLDPGTVARAIKEWHDKAIVTDTLCGFQQTMPDLPLAQHIVNRLTEARQNALNRLHAKEG